MIAHMSKPIVLLVVLAGAVLLLVGLPEELILFLFVMPMYC